MDIAGLSVIFIDHISSLAGSFDNQLVIGMLVFAVTAGVMGMCIPGLLVPISFSAGMLMGHWTAIPVVSMGAALGSHALFLFARHGLRERLQGRLGGRLDRFGEHLKGYGLAYVIGLRIVGTPHVMVTLASAAAQLRQSRFLVATLLGFLPAIALSAGAGSAL